MVLIPFGFIKVTSYKAVIIFWGSWSDNWCKSWNFCFTKCNVLFVIAAIVAPFKTKLEINLTLSQVSTTFPCEKNIVYSLMMQKKAITKLYQKLHQPLKIFADCNIYFLFPVIKSLKNTVHYIWMIVSFASFHKTLSIVFNKSHAINCLWI